MLAYKPHHGVKKGLGQGIAEWASGITGGMAKDIVREAEPAVRRLIREERHRFSEAILGGLPFLGVSAIAYVVTRYLVPDGKSTAKGVGYLASAASGTVGAWYMVSELRGTPETPGVAAEPGQPSSATSATVNTVAANAAKAVVSEAEPKVRKIVDEEISRIAAAGQAALPFAVGSIATFLATFFLVDSKNNKIKALGYTGSALLLGAGAWIGLEKEKEVA